MFIVILIKIVTEFLFYIIVFFLFCFFVYKEKNINKYKIQNYTNSRKDLESISFFTPNHATQLNYGLELFF